MPRREHMAPGYEQDQEIGQGDRHHQKGHHAVIALDGEERDPPYACPNRCCPHHHRAGPQDWLLALRPDRRRRLGRTQPSGHVRCDRSQLRVGSRRERPAHPQVEFFLVQPALHECGLEDADHPLAVGMRRAQVATVSCPGHLVSWRCHHRRLPTTTMQVKRSARQWRDARPQLPGRHPGGHPLRRRPAKHAGDGGPDRAQHLPSGYCLCI